MSRFYKEPNATVFFKLLPIDWKDDIVKYYSSNQSSTHVYLLEENGVVKAGGIVFQKTPPDMQFNFEESDYWFNNGYLYLGFIWVLPEFRKQKFGSKWLAALKKKIPSQKFWLTTEDKKLNAFYVKNGFKLQKQLESTSEWLLTYTPRK